MQTERARVVQKAVMRAAEKLEINKSTLGEILGLSGATVTRMYQGNFKLSEKSKEYENALLLLRMYAAMADLLGQPHNFILWLNGHNYALGDKPIALLVSTEGLVQVVGYLESHSYR